MIFLDPESCNYKKRFYAIASKAELTDIYAKARFNAEPWYLVEKRIKEGRKTDGTAEGTAHECSRV